MSFKTRELMIDVLPAARPFRPGAPGFGLCAEATRNEDEEDDEVDCGEATRAGGEPAYRDGESDLAVLKQQLRQAMQAMPVQG
ncbi:MAG TPA: hypothetical protein VFC23_13985 [Thermoanaerobaculia bacterium]|nr:hypothetical protein [Thermoanaerobaculia bacterium]